MPACEILLQVMSAEFSFTGMRGDALIYLAAAGEKDTALWEERFASLLRSGLLALPAAPGAEFGIRAPVVRNPQFAIDRLSTELLQPALQSGCAVSLDLSSLAEPNIRQWQRQLARLPEACGQSDGTLSLSVTAGSHASDLLRSKAADGSGYSGPMLLRYDLQESGGPAWQTLVATTYQDSLLQPVPASAIRPLSALHNQEKGQVIMPLGLFDVPAQSAWLTLEIDALRLGRPAQLRPVLGRCLRFADNLIDMIDWPQPSLRLDALLNRRVAVHLKNIGNRVVREGLDPLSPVTFAQLQRWVQFIRGCFVHESLLLARRRGPFPELRSGDLYASLAPRYSVAEARSLLRNRLLRHRHLLALSPLSIFPAAGNGANLADWIGLIPTIGCADAITMRGPDIRRQLTLKEWERVLRLTGAVAANTVSCGRKQPY